MPNNPNATRQTRGGFNTSLLLTQREKVKDRIENVFASKYEGIPRIDSFYERAILNCFDDSNFTAKEELAHLKSNLK